MGDRYKIAFIVTRADPIGGVQIHIRDLSLHLFSQGCDVTVLTGGTGHFTDFLEKNGIRCRIIPHLVRPISPRQDLQALSEIRRVLKELQPDLISTHSSKAGLLGRLAARSLGIPAIFTAHGWAFTEGVPANQARIYSTIERFAAYFTRIIINVSEHDRQLALKKRITRPEKLITIHNGVTDIPRSLRAEPAKQPPRLVMVARFEEQKDHASLLRALHGLKENPWTLDLVGDGPGRSDIERLAVNLGIADRVHFAGESCDVARHLAQAQLFLLISNWEGFPRSTLEAMRAGLPVIVSDVGGAKEAIVEGATGYVIPRGDVQLLRDRLATLLDDPWLRERMGEAARRRYEREYTFEHVQQHTSSVYQRLLAGRTVRVLQPEANR